ncbi:hypothetical protein AB0L06_02090 [Spirillospora sp. NPDC052269]
MRNLHRWAKGALAVTISATAISGTAVLSETTANADSGFCGVRSDSYTDSGYYIYVVRNKCATTQRFRVYMPTFGRYSKCATIAGGQRAYYAERAADQAWQIQNC